MLNQYHPPFAPGFIRENEVLLRVKGGEAAVLKTMSAGSGSGKTDKSK